jgi:hypothetical protein
MQEIWIENTPSEENKREEHPCRLTGAEEQERKATGVVLLKKPLGKGQVRCM